MTWGDHVLCDKPAHVRLRCTCTNRAASMLCVRCTPDGPTSHTHTDTRAHIHTHTRVRAHMHTHTHTHSHLPVIKRLACTLVLEHARSRAWWAWVHFNTPASPRLALALEPRSICMSSHARVPTALAMLTTLHVHAHSCPCLLACLLLLGRLRRRGPTTSRPRCTT